MRPACARRYRLEREVGDVLERIPDPAFMPCAECGESVARAEKDEHVCERERWLEYQFFVQHADMERFAEDFAAYLDSPEGRFQVWDAERKREEEG